MVTCPSCGQENPDRFQFCGACGSPLRAPEPAPEEERKVITALFTDIVGSTARAETLDPEDVRAMLAPYYARLRRELERFGGTVEKFIGDAVVALFGAPIAHEDDPERAVRAALAIGNAVADLNSQHEWLDLHIRTAVNTGEALVVVGARAVEGEGMAAGDVMNTAARLQGAAPVDGIAVGEATYRATRELFEYEAAEPVAAKGKAEPVPVWIVVGEKAPRRPDARRRLVGRDEELGRLASAWERALTERRPQLVNVIGSPGVGKSRLLAELCERVGGEAATHRGRCLPYGEGITYWPVTEIVKDAAGISHGDDAETMSRKLGALLESLPTQDRDELRTMAAALANLLGAATTPEGTYTTDEIGQAELHWGIRRVVELLATERPLLLIFEDLHWAEPTLLELLISMIDATAPLLIVGSARPEFVDTSPAFAREDRNRHLLPLEPLGLQESEDLLGELVGSGGIDVTRLGLLLRNAGGNPLFLEETVRMLADADLLGADVEFESLPVPETLQTLIGSRLDALSGADKRVAQQASVVGSVFWLGAVAHMAESNGDLTHRLSNLEHRDFVHANPDSTIAGELEYAFKHILIRDVAYERLPKGRRAELHVRFSQWLTGVSGTGDEFVEIVAYHLEQACRLAREVVQSPIAPPVAEAVEALKRSALKAERREGVREADRFYERALELLADDEDALALEIRLRRARITGTLGDMDAAELELAVIAEQASRIGDPSVRCEALVLLANLDQILGRASEARRRLVEARQLAQELGERALTVRAEFGLAALRADFDGELDAAAADLERATVLADELGDRALRIEGNMRLGTLLFGTGRLREAEQHQRRARTLAEELGSHRDEARALSLLSIYRYYLGHPEEAEEIALQALEWLERTGDTYLQLQTLRDLAMYALAKDDPDVAEQRLRTAVPLALEVGGWLVIEIYRFLIEAHVRKGQVDDARELVAYAERNLPEEDPFARAAWLIGAALVATAEDEREAAVERFGEALALLEEQHMPIDVGEAQLAFARALRQLGDLEGARSRLEQARAVFAPIEAATLLRTIERELAALETEQAGFTGPLQSA